MASAGKKRAVQQVFEFARPRKRGAGRKPKVSGQPGVSHRRRPELSGKHPVHVTLKVGQDVPNLRRQAFLGVLMACLRAGRERQGFRLCHFVVMGNHLHLVVEGDSAEELARGMQGLCIRLAKQVNRVVGRRGRFFADRYHGRVLRTPTEVHRVLSYVLLNLRKHVGEKSARVPEGLDAFSSGAWFDGWRRPVRGIERWRERYEKPVAEAKTWLVRGGWRRGGPLL